MIRPQSHEVCARNAHKRSNALRIIAKVKPLDSIQVTYSFSKSPPRKLYSGFIFHMHVTVDVILP